MDIKIETGWKEVLKQEFNKPYFLRVVTFFSMDKKRIKQL
jgi:uracil-DNA glycosylase